jgi:hypothetical protein
MALMACTSDADPGGDSTATAAPTVQSGSPSAVSEAALVAQYEAALATVGQSDTETLALLAEIRDQHRAHLDALGGAPEAPVPSPASSAQTVLADLVAAERGAYKERVAACVDATEPDLARVLALIAASEAAHVPALRGLRSGGAA